MLNWCADQGAAAIPYGGGTSVVGGVEPRMRDDYPAVVTLDLRRMNRVLEIDPVSKAARIQAGATGPVLEDQLREHGLAAALSPVVRVLDARRLDRDPRRRPLRHALHPHRRPGRVGPGRDPGGEWESRRLPGSGAGPSPDRMLVGSEGILGVIVDAWVRVRERPHREGLRRRRVRQFAAGAEAVREISQSGLNPSNCRLLDATESATSSAGPPGKAVLVLGFESAHHPVEDPMSLALEVCRNHGGDPGEMRRSGAQQPGPEARRGSPAPSEAGDDPVNAWRHAFLFAPYLRDSLVACGVLSDTFETAITWDRFPDFHAEVMESARRAVAGATGAPADGPGSPRISCRFTHVYPDGPARTTRCSPRPGAETRSSSGTRSRRRSPTR